MRIRVRRIGNSLGILLPKALLDASINAVINPRIRAICLAGTGASSEQPAIHPASLCVKSVEPGDQRLEHRRVH